MASEQINNSSDGADSQNNLHPYRTKVAAMMRQLSELKLSLTPEKLEGYDDADLSAWLEYVEQVWRETGVMEGSERMNFVSLYLDVKSRLRRQLSSIQKVDVHTRSSMLRQLSIDRTPFCEAQSPSRKTRLPEIQLPQFSGAYEDWTNFHTLFNAVIDENGDLSDLEKFHHLRSSLTGVALDVILSLEINNENYREALNLL